MSLLGTCITHHGVGCVGSIENESELLIRYATDLGNYSEFVSVKENPELLALFTPNGQLRADEALALFSGLDWAFEECGTWCT